MMKHLIEASQLLIEEKKRAILEEKQKDRAKFEQENGMSAFSMIICPRYHYNEKLKVYQEVKAPPASLYKTVGFNNLEVVKRMMDGDDAERRQGFVGVKRKH